MSLIALHQSTVNKMTLEELATSVRDPSTATKLKKALILAEAQPVEQEKMERALSTDLERVASSISNDGEAVSMNIQLLSNDSSLGDAQIRVPEGQIARDAIQAAYATLTADQMKRLVVCMGGDEIDMESSFEANGIEDGARLEVCRMLYPYLCIWHCC